MGVDIMALAREIQRERLTSSEVPSRQDPDANYKYGGDAAAGFLMGERRRIVRPEQSMVIGYEPDGSQIIETIPAQYGPSEFDPSYSPLRRGARTGLSTLNDLLFGNTGEQSAAASGVGGAVKSIGEALAGQYRAGMAGGVAFNDSTQSIERFDPLAMAIGSAPAGIKAIRAAGDGSAVLGAMGGKIPQAQSTLRDLKIRQESFPKSYKDSVISSYTERDIDPRIFSAGSGDGSGDPRVGQIQRNLATKFDIGDQRIKDVPSVDLREYEGHPFMTSMSDRTAAGDTIRSIDGVPVNVSRRGGQDYMLDPLNPDYVWASDESVVLKPKGDGLSDVSMFKFAQDMKALSGGKDTLFMPWTMAPTGGDFSQVGEVMLSYAKNNMGSDALRALDGDIAKIIPKWKGLNDPMSVADFYAVSGNRRKEIINLMDKKYASEGSLTSGQARHAMTDEAQLMSRDGNLRNVGMLDTDRYPHVGSPHPAYSTAMYGQGLGRIDKSLQVYELMPQAAMLGGLYDIMRPPRPNLRALEMKPYGGIITEDILRGIEDRRKYDVEQAPLNWSALSGLDPSTAARMSRAKDQGYDTDRRLHHLTKDSFDEFITGGPEGIDGQKAVFLTPDPADQSASHNAVHSTSGANIMPVLTKADSPLYVDESNRREVMERWGITNREFPYLIDDKTKSILEEAGFDHIEAETTFGDKMTTEIIIFDPKKIRSTNAEFDPAKADSADLLSSIYLTQSSLRNIA